MSAKVGVMVNFQSDGPVVPTALEINGQITRISVAKCVSRTWKVFTEDGKKVILRYDLDSASWSLHN